jgi:hypothetical protein
MFQAQPPIMSIDTSHAHDVILHKLPLKEPHEPFSSVKTSSMNDPGLDQPINIQDTANTLKERIPSGSTRKAEGATAFRQELEHDDEEEEPGYFQPKCTKFCFGIAPIH